METKELNKTIYDAFVELHTKGIIFMKDTGEKTVDHNIQKKEIEYYHYYSPKTLIGFAYFLRVDNICRKRHGGSWLHYGGFSEPKKKRNKKLSVVQEMMIKDIFQANYLDTFEAIKVTFKKYGVPFQLQDDQYFWVGIFRADLLNPWEIWKKLNRQNNE